MRRGRRRAGEGEWALGQAGRGTSPSIVLTRNILRPGSCFHFRLASSRPLITRRDLGPERCAGGDSLSAYGRFVQRHSALATD